MRVDTPSRRVAAVEITLCAAGAIVAAVLTSFHFSAGAVQALCTRTGGCESVNSSPYSTVVGIPIALIGMGAYIVIGFLAFASTREWPIREMAPLAIFGLSLVGVLYSVYLTYLELFVIHAICPWCVASAVLMTALWVVSLADVIRRRRLDAAEADA